MINRAENNLTAKVFVTLFNAVGPQNLLSVLGLGSHCEPGTAKMELFWKGFRDYALQNKDCRKEFPARYRDIIPAVRNAVAGTRLHRRNSFYIDTDENKLFNELRNTETDVAIFTRSNIYLGEAKRKEKLGFNGRNILAHQFIRQRVAVEVLKGLTGDRRRVVSFIVCDHSKVRSLSRMEQVKALEILDGRKTPVISWQDIITWMGTAAEIGDLEREVGDILGAV